MKAKGRVRSGNTLGERFPELVAEWHPTKNGELTPFDVSCYSTVYAWWRCEAAGHEWQTSIIVRSRRQRCPFCCSKKAVLHNSLAWRFPELAKEWHPTRNGAVRPDEIFPFSDRRAWWMCARGHEWESSIRVRSHGNQCADCKKLVIAQECNELIYTRLRQEWHPKKNGRMTLDQISLDSKRRVWWQCKQGHSWRSPITPRITKDAGCPYCEGRKLGQDNSLKDLYPQIAREWHPTRNAPLTPADVLSISVKYVWWMCDRGHEWRRKVASHVVSRGCPYCLGRIVTPEISFGASFPEQAKEWLQEKNGDLTPFNISCFSNRRVWWRCSKGHEWEAVVGSRHRTGCPYCSKHTAMPERSLLNKNYYLSRQWHPNRNKNLTPKDIFYNSEMKVWWQCLCGHEWIASVRSRVRDGQCPMCDAMPGRVARITPEKVTPLRMADDRSAILLDHVPDLIHLHSQSTSTPDGGEMLTCLICGIQFPSLNWHLKATHQMSGDAYRLHFSLPADFPLSIASGKTNPSHQQRHVRI
ncbi:MAG: MucR family transcriptional regulator [Magnetococcales bacterium]|nr:MucR family transcriptional regulator [Magnetococcales bacterium]